LALIIFVVSEKKAFEHFPIGSVSVFYADLNPRWLPPQVIVLTQDHMGKYRNIFFSEAIALIEPKLCINHWKVLYKLRFHIETKNVKFVEYHPMNIHVQFGFNHICSFGEEGI
jgi:hypothetical protein